MKKIIALICILIIVCTTISAQAAGYALNNNVVIKHNNEFGFIYEEEMKDNNVIVRKYTPANNEQTHCVQANTSSNLEMTTALLLSMGLSQDTINNLSTAELEVYANSKGITSSVQYLATNSTGETRYLSECDAHNEAQPCVMPNVPVYDHIGDGSGTIPPIYEEELDDEHEILEMVFLITDLGDGEYMFEIEASWLTPPAERFTDCVSIIAQGVTPQENSVFGWFKYKYTDIDYLTGDEETEEVSVPVSTNIGGNLQAITDTWSGFGMTFELPNNWTYPEPEFGSPENSRIHEDFRVYFRMKARITEPSNELYFNAIACYEHAELALLPNASMGLQNGDPGVYFGFDFAIQSDPHPIMTDEQIHYYPN